MNFWATRLAGQAPSAPEQAPPAAQQVQGTWFSNPLLNGLQQAQPQQPQFQQAAEAQPLVVNTKKLLASRNAGICPTCGSGNFGRAGATNNYERCYDCGYNARFEQAMAGGGIQTGAEGAATPSQQVASGGGHGSVNNFHPETIVATYGT